MKCGYLLRLFIPLIDTHVVFWIQFDNKTYQARSLVTFPQLSDLTGPTFFRVRKMIVVD